MSSVSSYEESNGEDVDDLDNLVESHAVQENIDEQETVEVEEQGNSNDEAQEVPTRGDPKPKRVVKNPLPKLNADTLKGPRGIHTLQQVFEKVKFKGKGYEEHDLNLLMKTYEYWCHRLFPKFSFDDCLARIEKFGTKKAVQTHIKKIRYDLLTEDKIQLPSDNDEADVADQFDEIARPLDEPIQLTEEQLERIRLNKEKALKRLQDAKNVATSNLQDNENNGKISTESTINQLISETTNDLTGTFGNNFLTHEEISETLALNRENSLDNNKNSSETNNVEDSEGAKQNSDEDEEMDIESMLDVIAKGTSN